MAEWDSTVHICHTFLILSSIDGYIGCIHILAIVNNAALHIVVHITFLGSVSFSLNKYPGVELLDHMVILFLISVKKQ